MEAIPYAKAIFALGEGLVDELSLVGELIDTHLSLKKALFLDVFTPEEKCAVIDGLGEKLSFSPLAHNALHFLIMEGRISLLPDILKALHRSAWEKKGIVQGVLEGCAPAPLAVEEKIKRVLERVLKKSVQFEYKENRAILAGYRACVGDLQLDASLNLQFHHLKNDILRGSHAD